MAITAGRAAGSGTQTVADATWTDILPTSGAWNGCEEIVITCPSGSASALKIAVQNAAGNADTIHRIGVASANVPDDFYLLPVGASISFAGSIENKIRRVMVSGSGGIATVTWTLTKP